MSSGRPLSRRVPLVVAALAVAALSLSPAWAAAASAGVLFGAVPSATTPNVGDGAGFKVRAVVQLGGTVVQGGLFSTVTAPGSTTGVARSNLYAADAATGAISPGFAPALDGEVAALLPGPEALPGTVFVGGSFTRVNGVAVKGLALLNLGDGSLVGGFSTPSLDGVVNSLAVAGGRLLLGGSFSKVAGVAHAGLASVNPTTGALDPYLGVQLAGHHNYGVNCTPGSSCALGPVGASKLAVSPDGTQLMVAGNFTSADGASRDQVAGLTLTPAGAGVDPGWRTNLYHQACYAFAYDSYVRDVAYSADGSYLAIVATGGGGTPGAATDGCDAAARFESGAQGADLQPTWLDFTGNDTLFAVAITASAVYVGGTSAGSTTPTAAISGLLPRARRPGSGCPPKRVNSGPALPTGTSLVGGAPAHVPATRNRARPLERNGAHAEPAGWPYLSVGAGDGDPGGGWL